MMNRRIALLVLPLVMFTAVGCKKDAGKVFFRNYNSAPYSVTVTVPTSGGPVVFPLAPAPAVLVSKGTDTAASPGSAAPYIIPASLLSQIPTAGVDVLITATSTAASTSVPVVAAGTVVNGGGRLYKDRGFWIIIDGGAAPAVRGQE